MWSTMAIIDGVLLALLAVFACSVAVFEDLLVNTLVLCGFSLTIATLYLVMNAPDVAITEASVGAGFSTVLLLLVLSKLGYNTKSGVRSVFYQCDRAKLIAASIITVVLFAMLVCVVMDLPNFGSGDSAANVAATETYLKSAYEYTGIPNLVTGILASFRGYDTLCETVVVFTAAVGVSLLISRGAKGS